MFEPTFVQHRGARILRIDFSQVQPAEVAAACEVVKHVVAAEPLRSLRVLSILHARLTVNAAAALKSCALADAPYIHASAMVGSRFWRVVATDVQAHGREELHSFDDEASALDWLAAQ